MSNGTGCESRTDPLYCDVESDSGYHCESEKVSQMMKLSQETCIDQSKEE